MVGLLTDVSGIVLEVSVHDNQKGNVIMDLFGPLRHELTMRRGGG
jgi:hypothetical protein